MLGVPLPLISAGGSALIMTLVAIGVVLSFARDLPTRSGSGGAGRGSAAGRTTVPAAGTQNGALR